VTVLVIQTHPEKWTEGGTFWEVGVSGVSDVVEVQNAYQRLIQGKSGQRY
jgi:TPP-dependent trihydroxycyclohexane-1,2-dione (THcHDO) dehydratase